MVDGRAYTQEQRGENEAVTCYELLSGKLVWIHSYPARFFNGRAGKVHALRRRLIADTFSRSARLGF